MQKAEIKQYKTLIKLAFAEDAPKGDITAQEFGRQKELGSAEIIAKADGILCGLEIARSCFEYVDRTIVFVTTTHDGAVIKKGTVIAKVTGPTDKILLAERTALNFLQHLSGIASQTNTLVKKIEKTGVKILDTRKTTPGWRYLEKYAVRCGNGINHRLGLSDMILIKENHLKTLTTEQLTQKLNIIKKKRPNIPIEIEAETVEQVRIFLELPVDRIMLDNMSEQEVKQAILLRKQQRKLTIKFEISGNVTAENICHRAIKGVEYISIGALTHSVKSLDLSLIML